MKNIEFFSKLYLQLKVLKISVRSCQTIRQISQANQGYRITLLSPRWCIPPALFPLRFAAFVRLRLLLLCDALLRELPPLYRAGRGEPPAGRSLTDWELASSCSLSSSFFFIVLLFIPLSATHNDDPSVSCATTTIYLNFSCHPVYRPAQPFSPSAKLDNTYFSY